MKKNYIGFARMGSVFGPAIGAGEYNPHLPAGHYKVAYDDEYNDNLTLTEFTPKMDEILNLGGKEFNFVINSVSKFLSPQAQAKFDDKNFLLKRSFLLYGPPGTGKSVLSCKVSDIAIKEKNAIALYPDSFEALERVLEVLADTDKDRFKVINLEEFDDLIHRHDEARWTTLLDGQFQTANRLVVATTNHVDSIPKRLLRPGRFSSLIEIPCLTAEARDSFLKAKGVNEKLRKLIVEKTKDYTIDELKEVVQSVCLLDEEAEFVIDSINKAKSLGREE